MFHWNASAGVIKWVNASGGKPYCLDIWAWVGPQLDFYGNCNSMNQQFSFDPISGNLKPSASAAAGNCVTFTGGAQVSAFAKSS